MSLGVLQLAKMYQYWPITSEWHRENEGTEPNVALNVSVAALEDCYTMHLGHDAGSAPLTPSLEAFPSTTLLLVSLPVFLWDFFPH